MDYRLAEIWREKYYNRTKELVLVEAKLDKATKALHEIMVEGTGSQGNSTEASIAYETLGELGYFEGEE